MALREKILSVRRKGWFANGLLLIALVWWTWNWFAPQFLRFDTRDLALLVFLYSVEASWASALIYQQTSRADEELRRSLTKDRDHVVAEVREVIRLLRDVEDDVELLVAETENEDRGAD